MCKNSDNYVRKKDDEKHQRTYDLYMRVLSDNRLGHTVREELREIWDEVALCHDMGQSYSSERASASLAALPHGLGPWLAAVYKGLWLAYEDVLVAMSESTKATIDALGGKTKLTELGWEPTEDDLVCVAGNRLREAMGYGRDLALSCGDIDLATTYRERYVRLKYYEVLPLEMSAWCTELDGVRTIIEEMLADERDVLDELVRDAVLEGGELA